MIFFKTRLKRYLDRKWQLFRAPKDQRPVLRLIWEKMDGAQEQMAVDLGHQLYVHKNFDGLGSIIEKEVNLASREPQKFDLAQLHVIRL